tara:strand:- start:224 stop:763 length:540 start_codon:yes stop_codon:yes gene_type:complete
MIKPQEINIALGDDGYRQLFWKMQKYIEISEVEVQEIIAKGTTGIYEKLEKLVAWCLGLNKYFPKGWEPVEIVPVVEPRQLVMGLKERPPVKYKYMGVFKVGSGKHRASICDGGTTRHLGTYETANEAAMAYNDEAAPLGKSLNIIIGPLTKMITLDGTVTEITIETYNEIKSILNKGK